MGTKNTTTTKAATKAAAAVVTESTATELHFFQYGKRNGEICETFRYTFSAEFQGAVDKARLANFVGRKLYELAAIYEKQKALGMPFGGFSASKPLEFHVVGTGLSSFGTIKNAFGAYIKGKKGGALATREQLTQSVLSMLELISVVRESAEI